MHPQWRTLTAIVDAKFSAMPTMSPLQTLLSCTRRDRPMPLPCKELPGLLHHHKAGATIFRASLLSVNSSVLSVLI